MKFLLFLMAVSFTFASAAPKPDSGQVAIHTTVQVEYDYHYLLTLPAGYDDDATQRWPLLVYLHGSGEQGDLGFLRTHSLPKYIDEGHNLPFVVVAPLCPAGESWSSPALEALLAELMRTHRIDPDRVYLTGVSMGGHGVWTLATRHPERYAAIIPICGGGDPKRAPRMRSLPVWAFHGALDKAVPVTRSQEMIDAIKAAGGSPQLTIYPDGEHNVWNVTYANEEIYTWLLSHRRGR